MLRRVLTVVTSMLILLSLISCGTANIGQGVAPDKLASAFRLDISSDSFLFGASAAGFDLGLEEQGQEVLVKINVRRASRLTALYLTLQYDPSTFTPLLAQPEAAMGSREELLYLSNLRERGTVHYGQVLIDPARHSGFSGDGTLVQLRFRRAAMPWARCVSDAPDSDLSETVLTINPAGDLLSWGYYNQGDYDQNGRVAVQDLTPIGLNFQLNVDDAPDGPRAVVDGNADGTISVQDLTPIGVNFGHRLDSYNVYASDDIGDFPLSNTAPSSIAPLGTVPFSEAVAGVPAGARKTFSFAVTPDVNMQYWVRPEDDTSQEGTPSVVATNGVAPPPEYTAADGFNGGQLYDKFWASETGWDQGDPNLAVFNGKADFFRCKQCHGWDLLGSQGAYIGRAPNTNRPNVSPLNLHSIAGSSSPQELFDALKRSTGRRSLSEDLSTYDPVGNPTIGDQMPDLSSFFTDEQLWELTKFLKAEAVDTSTLYDQVLTGSYPTGSVSFSNIGRDGNASDGATVYANNCAVCHGADGSSFLVDGDTYTVGSFTRSKPNEGQHKIKFGQLGSSMGGLVTNDNDLKNLYKALADEALFPDPVPPEYTAADGLNGGQLYDKFWAAETGWDQGDPNLATFNAKADFFRCKQCHGWDLLGTQGGYIGRAPSTNRPNVSSLDLRSIAASSSPQELFDALKRSTGRRSLAEDLSTYDPVTNATIGDQMPDLSSFFTDAQLWDLVKFMKEEYVNPDQLYDFLLTGTYPTGSIAYSDIGKDGDSGNGDTLYANRCAGCHGADGSAFLVDGGVYTVGSFTRAKPNESMHKYKFGQLGSTMGGLMTDDTELKDLLKALSSIASYPDP